MATLFSGYYQTRSRWHNLDGASWTSWSNAGGFFPQGPTVNKISNPTPGFKALLAGGGTLPVNIYERSDVNTNYGYTLSNWQALSPWNWGDGGRDWEVRDYYQVVALPAPATIESLYLAERESLLNERRAKFQEKLNNTDFDLPVFLGELKETVGMLAGAVHSTGRFVRDFRNANGNFYSYAQRLLEREYTNRNRSREYKKMIRDLNDLHLQFQYGWKPLAGDVEDAYDFVVKTLEQDFHVKKSSYGFFVRQGSSTSAATPVNGAQWTKRDHWWYKHELWLGGILEDPASFDSIPTRLGANYGTVALTAWELTRFSFLFDYVSNVQSVIGNLSLAWLKLRTGTMYMSTRTQYAVWPELLNPTGSPDGILNYNLTRFETSKPYKATYSKFRRDPIDWTDLVVRFELEVPSRAQLIKSASLLASAVLRN